MSPETLEAVRWVQSMATLLIATIVCVAIVMIYNACPDPNAHPENRKKGTAYELCKLHQRPRDKCVDMHDQDPPDDHKEDA